MIPPAQPLRTRFGPIVGLIAVTTLSATARAEAPLEVEVLGEKEAPSVSTLSRAEARQVPGSFGDPFRAIDTLPGVTPIVSGLPFFYIRGAPPGNIGYFLDGVRVPYLFHIAIGPSVVNPALVDKVDLYSGGYPAQYGRYAGAIVAAGTTAPRTDWHGEGNVRIFDAGGMVEGGFDGGRGTVLIGGRYSYTAAIISLFAKGGQLDYRDFQARVTYDLTTNDRLSVFAFGSYDLLATNQGGVQEVLFGSEFYRVDLRYDRRLEGDGNLRLAVTGGFDQTHITSDHNARDVALGTRFTLEKPVAPGLTLSGGLDAQFDGYTADPVKYVDPADPAVKAFDALFPARNDSTLGSWAQAAWTITPRVLLTPGLRLDVFQSAGTSVASVDGRLALTVQALKHVRLLHAVGLAHQPPSFIAPLPGLAVGNLKDGLQSSAQASAGIEVEWPDVLTATVTGFDSVFLNMSDMLSMQEPSQLTTQKLLSLAAPRSLGSTYGLEVYLRRRFTKKLGGFLSYTLSRSLRAAGRDTFPSAFDRTHVLNLALAYDLGWRWRAGGRFTYYTGAPQLSAVLTHAQDPPRDPPFYRIDARLEKRWRIWGGGWLAAVIEGFNVTLQKETVSGQAFGPIALPSIGVEGGF